MHVRWIVVTIILAVSTLVGLFVWVGERPAVNNSSNHGNPAPSVPPNPQVDASVIVPVSTTSIEDILSHGSSQAIRAILHDRNIHDTTRNMAADRVRRLDPQGAVDDFMDIVQDRNEHERFRSFAVQHLGLVWRDAGDKTNQVRTLLCQLLDDHHVAVVREALLVLGQANDKVAEDRMRFVLADSSTASDIVREIALRVAGEHGWTWAATAGVRVLSHPDPALRGAAVVMLGQLGLVEHLAALRLLLDDPDPQVSGAARIAVAAISGGQGR